MKSEITKIHILIQSFAERIAANEVVERPASVVNELIGNPHARINRKQSGCHD